MQVIETIFNTITGLIESVIEGVGTVFESAVDLSSNLFN